MGPGREDLADEHRLRLRAGVGDAVGQDEDAVAAIGGLDEGDRTTPLVLIPASTRVPMPRSLSCWWRSVVEAEP
ncbi:hypothetical protein M878_38940 [Streptomyces roseochromogenus subsp. oscitans DS 12.976]|uniref:Uncharacterized protein n=1 Tax=Streptomyces roseochromogenus subsp. oscitans DS 12.976 TaxID=1352936 RepID=V6JV36_STRRC|nr:hypothetical protein M878_38940 [Streptomyces roseochromogenus subsp. oscitans DS 12.976]